MPSSDLEFPPSQSTIVGFSVLSAAAALFSMFIAAVAALGLGRIIILGLPKSVATGLAVLAVSALLAAWFCWCALGLYRSRKVSVLILDGTGIHAPRESRSASWCDIQKVEIVNNDGAPLLQLTPGNSATDRWWRRIGGCTAFDISFIKGRHTDIVSAIRAHPDYRGS